MTQYVKKVTYAVGTAAVSAVIGAAVARARQRRNLDGQVVLITGGSRGFGLALARELAKLQCRIALCARDQDELARAKQTLERDGHEVFTIPCDVSEKDRVTGMVEAVGKRYGKIDILINNAGEIMVSPFENLDAADFERAMDVMFRGPLNTTLAVLPLMKTRGRGRIVNVTSIGGKVSVPHLLSYSCAKAAEAAFSEGLRNEVRQFGIEVTTIIPGLMRTGSHVNASFKGNRVTEAAWFGAAASLPLLSLSAEHAARLAVKAICAGKTESILGVPAQILSRAQTLLPGLTAEVLRFSNTLLPKGTPDHSMQTGRELDDQHGSLYRLLTTLGRRAGQRLNQPV